MVTEETKLCSLTSQLKCIMFETALANPLPSHHMSVGCVLIRRTMSPLGPFLETSYGCSLAIIAVQSASEVGTF